MEQKIANEKRFIKECKKYVAEIERYDGTDPLAPWYRYMLWLEENYDIDFSGESLFMDILCRCLATYEANDRYKQDRRLIKLFIKYISYQERPEEHYNLMHSEGVGTRVADLYICWAHWFNIVGNFDRAEEIYQLGFKAKARSSRLLERAHHAFGVNMSKRVLNKADPKYEEKVRSQLQKKYNQFIGLDLSQESTDPKPEKLQTKLREFDRPEAYAIPFCRTENASPATPQRQMSTSLLQTIVNSCSTRKKRHESQRTLHPPTGSRLYFGDEKYPPIPVADDENMYARGIRLPKNFVAHNAPQRVVTVPPVRDDDLASIESNVLNLPMYDKIMLLPAVDKSYSPEELMAYKWYKAHDIINEFTIEMDAVWSVGWHVPFRRGDWLVSKNLPQRDEVQEMAFYIDGPIADGIWRFAFDIEQHHPKDSDEEFSREELLWQKRIKSSSVAAKKPSSILQTINWQKKQLALQKTIESTPRPSTSKQSATREKCRSKDISAVTSGTNSSQYVLEKKMDQSEMIDDGSLNMKRHRKTSFESNELSDTCTTQLFGMSLKRQAISTPNPKMGLAKFEIFIDESMAQAPDANATAMKSMVNEKVGADNNNFKFQLFTDESIAQVNGEEAAQANINVVAKPAGFKFEIYRDETRVVSEVIRLNAEKQLTQAATEAPAALVNDENRPVDCLPIPTPGQPIRSTANNSEQPLKEVNVTMGAIKPQHSDLNYSFAITDVEKGLLMGNLKKVDFSFDFEDLNIPKMVEKLPSIDEADSEEGDLLRQSIYVPREEVIFSDAEHANWLEVPLHLAEGPEAKNAYVAEPIYMNHTLQIIDAQLLDLMKLSPFDSKLQKALLDSVSFVDRLAKMDRNVCDMVKIVQPMKPRAKLTLANRTFSIQKMIGSGNFGKVFCGECCHTKAMLAFKQERPPNLWEYYICLEVQKRLENKRIRDGCLSIEYALIGNNATIFASKFSSFGTMLNVCNKVKVSTNRNMDEYVVMVFAKQMLTIIDALHRVNIIHGDIKPDNFLLMNPLDYDYDVAPLSLQLIDFGQSIDMKLFPIDQVFYSKVKTENFVCTEMMDNRPWTFQLDLFCLASTIYMMVIGEYMVVRKENKNSSRYKTGTIPRYYNRMLWTHLFDKLINIPDPRRMPDLSALRKLLDDEIDAIGLRAMREKITDFNKALTK